MDEAFKARIRSARPGWGFRRFNQKCPDCGYIMNGVKGRDGEAKEHGQTLLVCPIAIGEQANLGNGLHFFPAGSLHKKLAWWVLVDDKLKSYKYVSKYNRGGNGDDN